MNLPALIEAVARETCWPRTKVERVARSLFRQMQAGLRQDRELHIFGFGRFVVKKMPDRTLKDLRTGEQVVASGKDRVWFQPYRRTARAIRRKK